jgi:large subunit ribosomal protein L29
MPIMRIKDIVSMSAEDRTNKLYDLRAELARIRTMINAGGAVENPTKVRELRKAIAQILTIQHEEKLGIRKKAETKTEKKAEKPKTAKAKKEPKETAPQ